MKNTVYAQIQARKVKAKDAHAAPCQDAAGQLNRRWNPSLLQQEGGVTEEHVI